MSLNLRQELLAKAIKLADATNKPRTVEGLGPFLPADFGLVDLDLQEMAALEPIEAEFHAVESADTATVDDSDFIDAPAIERVKMALTPDEAQDNVVAANNALAQSRADLIVCQRREHEASGALAQAITQFQSGFEKYTPIDQAHDFARSEMELRRRVACGEAPARERPRPGNSTVDRMAYGRADIESGRYGAHRRGAFPASQRGAYVGPPVKLPSAR
jgi:hypothetical protein